MKAGSCHTEWMLPETAEIPVPADQQPAWTEPTRVVGARMPRIDGYHRASGSAIYTADLNLPDMLHVAIVRCPHAHATVSKVDTSAALKMPGVHAVLTSADREADLNVPYPWWVEDGPPMRLFDPHCRYAGEEVAAVAAETPEEAWDAARAIKAEYQALPFVSRPEDALTQGAAQIHANGNLSRKPYLYERGDLARGFMEADTVIEQTYRTSDIFQSCIEAHVSAAQWYGDRLTVWDSNQGVFDFRRYVAQAFGLPLSSVRVISTYMGGGFGCKAELGKYTVIAAVMARKTARPVKCAVTREDIFTTCGNRPANIMRLKAGAKKDGQLTALHMASVGSVGAYGDWADVGGQVLDLYRCANCRVEGTEVFTNTGKARAMRAPESPRCSWALEQMMDALADKIGMDPVEFRLRNLPETSQWEKRPYTSTGLKQCLTDGAKAFGWKYSKRTAPRPAGIVRGVGMAACEWFVSSAPPATAMVKLLPDGSVNLNTGASDLGTGTKTVLAMVVSEELGVPLTNIEVEHADTATTHYAQGSGGSKTVAVNSPAVHAAAVDVRRQLLALAAEELKVPAEELTLKDGAIVRTNDPQKVTKLSELKLLAQREGIIAVGHRGPAPAKSVVAFGAQFAEIEINTRTGEIRVLRFLAAHDSGRVINPLTFENQIFGGVMMGVGFALTENRVLDARQSGRVLNGNWYDYKVPTAKDGPSEFSWISIDPHDTECNSTGTKGIGEPATIPTAPAIANAIYNATGIRCLQAPVSPMEMLRLIAANKGK